MAFVIEAYVLSMKKGQGAEMMYDIISVGLWKGQEFLAGPVKHDGSLTGITTAFENMAKAKPEKPKPLTLTWKPKGTDALIFSNKFRRATLHMRVGIRKDDYSSAYTLNFDGVKVVRTSKSKSVERIDASYLDFRLDTSL